LNPTLFLKYGKLQNEIYEQTIQKEQILNSSKSSAALFTPDPKEQEYTLNLTLGGEIIPTNPKTKIFSVTFDAKLTFCKHTKNTKKQNK